MAAQPESTEAWQARPGAARAPLARYRRREPEHTILHAVVRERLESFLAAARSARPTVAAYRRSSSATCAATRA